MSALLGRMIFTSMMNKILLKSILCSIFAVFMIGAQAQDASQRHLDSIVAIVQHEPITYSQLQIQILSLKQEYDGQTMPGEKALQKMALQRLVTQSALAQRAQEYGIRAEDDEIKRSIARIATSYGVTPEALVKQLADSGIPYATLKHTIEQQIMISILREVTLDKTIVVSNAEIEEFLAKNDTGSNPEKAQLSLAQILIAVPEGATEAQEKQLLEKTNMVYEKVKQIKQPQEFLALVEQYSDDPYKAQTGGAFGIRATSDYPDLFVQAVLGLQPGGVAPPVRSGAGYHILLVLDREQSALTVMQTHARHILLEASSAEEVEKAVGQQRKNKHLIETGQDQFEAMAREQSKDSGSAAQGGDIGWVAPGMLVPEFEEVMNQLKPGEVSEPVITRYGVHLIEVLERRESELTSEQKREVARQTIHMQKVQDAYAQWAQNIEHESYVEYKNIP